MALFGWWGQGYKRPQGTTQVGPWEFRIKPWNTVRQSFKSTLFFHINFIYFLAALGLCCCTQAFSSCGEQGLLFVAVLMLLIAVASLVAEHRL